MVDPLSVTGVAIGATSLTFQIFDGCIKGFKFIVDASRMERSIATGRLSLIIEFNRFMEWGKRAGLVEDETGNSIATSIGASQLELAAIMSEISTLLQEFNQLNERYEKLIDDNDPKARAEAESDAEARNLMNELNTMCLKHEKTRTIRAHAKGTNHLQGALKFTVDFVKRPKRILWTGIDQEAFDKLLKDLRHYIDRLIELMGSHQMREIELNVKKSYLNIIQLVDNTQSLTSLMAAIVLLTAKKADESLDPGTDNETMLLTLAQLKTLTQPHGENGEKGPRIAKAVSVHRITYKTKEQPREKWSMATLKSANGVSETLTPVWIEWKPYQTEILDLDSGREEIHPGSLRRTSELSVLLNFPKPSGFATPTCLGYFDEKEEEWTNKRTVSNGRFGWIFRMEPNVPSSCPPTPLLSLFTTLSTPSLSDRFVLAVRIAESVLYLHAVNWLHKAIRSENVIYLYDNRQGTAPSWSTAIMSGFEYSRPDKDSTTDLPRFVPARDIYRWPEIQGQVTTERRSRKTYDIYATGLLLVEIAYWQPLPTILKYGDIKTVSADQAKAVRGTLLAPHQGYIAEIKRRMGSMYGFVVEKCLKGHDGFGISKDDRENDPVVGLKIQQLYMTDVVEKLQSIRI